MGDIESLVGVIMGSYRIRHWPNHKKSKDKLHNDLLESLKKYFQGSKLHSVGFPFLDGDFLLWVGALDEYGAQKVTFTLVLSHRLMLYHRQEIQKRLKRDLGAVGVSIFFVGSLPDERSDGVDFDRFETDDVRAEYDSLLEAFETTGTAGIEFSEIFVKQPQTNPQIREALIHTMLSKELIKVVDEHRLSLKSSEG